MATYVPKSYDLTQPLPTTAFKIDWDQVGEIIEIINKNFIRGDFSMSYRLFIKNGKREYGDLEIKEALSKFRRCGWKQEEGIDSGGITYISFHQAL